MDVIGRSLVVFGAVMLVLGGLVLLGSRVPFLGRLPGDVFLQRDGAAFYFPLVTSIILSLLLTILASVAVRLLGK